MSPAQYTNRLCTVPGSPLRRSIALTTYGGNISCDAARAEAQRRQLNLTLLGSIGVPLPAPLSNALLALALGFTVESGLSPAKRQRGGCSSARACASRSAERPESHSCSGRAAEAARGASGAPAIRSRSGSECRPSVGGNASGSVVQRDGGELTACQRAARWWPYAMASSSLRSAFLVRSRRFSASRCSMRWRVDASLARSRLGTLEVERGWPRRRSI